MIVPLNVIFLEIKLFEFFFIELDMMWYFFFLNSGNWEEDKGATGCLWGDEERDQQSSARVQDAERRRREHEAGKRSGGQRAGEITGRNGETQGKDLIHHGEGNYLGFGVVF